MLQMLEHGSEQLFRHERVALTVGMRERVFAGGRGRANRRQRPRVQTERITNIVKTDGMRQLRIEQTDDMTPWTKRSALGVHSGVSCQLRHQMIGNQMAELSQECETTARWLGGCGFLHSLPCGRSIRLEPTSFFSLRTPNPLTLWDYNGFRSLAPDQYPGRLGHGCASQSLLCGRRNRSI